MALTVGVDSWVTLTEANNYFACTYGRGSWSDLSDADKEQLLKHAYKWINQQSSLSIPATSTASIVKEAQCETAWYIYNYFAQHEKRRATQAQGVTDFKIMNFQEKYNGMGDFPSFIEDMLEDFLTDLGGTFPTVTRDFE